MSEKTSPRAAGRLTHFPSLSSRACIYRSLTHLPLYLLPYRGRRCSAPRTITSTIYLQRPAPRQYHPLARSTRNVHIPTSLYDWGARLATSWTGLRAHHYGRLTQLRHQDGRIITHHVLPSVCTNTIGLMHACMQTTTNGGILYPRGVRYGS